MRITLPSGVRPAHTSCTAETPSRDEFMSNWINLRLVDMRSLSGAFLPWLTEINYLGVHIVESKSFKILTDQSRRSFYRAANAIFARVGRIASEEVVLHLMSTKFNVYQSCYTVLKLVR